MSVLGKVDYDFYYKLFLDNKVIGKPPKKVLNSDEYISLIRQRTIIEITKGRGVNIIIKERTKFEEFFNSRFKIQTEEINTRAQSQLQFRNTKVKKSEDKKVFFIRGFKSIIANDVEIDLETSTNKFGLFAIKEPKIKTDNICFVENLESFLNAEKIFGKDYIYMHKYGRIGKESIMNFNVKNVIVFSDYDFVGLNEYLKIKSVFVQAKFYIPDNFDSLFKSHSTELPVNQNRYRKVMSSELEDVVRVREKLLRDKKFLEQEILLIN